MVLHLLFSLIYIRKIFLSHWAWKRNLDFYCFFLLQKQQIHLENLEATDKQKRNDYW